MNVNILYSTNCTLTIYFRESCELASADWRQQFTNLQDAINAGKDILENAFVYSATGVVVWDSNTGEVLAEILRDEDE